MDRFCLTDPQWTKMQPFCLGKPSDPGRTVSVARSPHGFSSIEYAGLPPWTRTQSRLRR